MGKIGENCHFSFLGSKLQQHQQRQSAGALFDKDPELGTVLPSQLAKKSRNLPIFSQHMRMDWPILTYLGLILSCLKLIQTKPVIYYTNPVMFRTERQTD